MAADVPVNPLHAHPFASLREIARSLSAAWDLDTTLDLIARKTTEVMRVNSCTIYLLDTDSQTLRLRASTGLARQALGRATLQIGEGMTGHAVARNRPIYAADAQHDPHFKWVDDTEEVRFRSLLAMPLVLNDRPIGALNVQTAEPRDYDEDEIELLALICDLAAGALAKAQLYDRQRRQLDDLRTLAQVSEAITSPQYLDDILTVVTGLAAGTVGAIACSIYLLESAGDDLDQTAKSPVFTPPGKAPAVFFHPRRSRDRGEAQARAGARPPQTFAHPPRVTAAASDPAHGHRLRRLGHTAAHRAAHRLLPVPRSWHAAARLAHPLRAGSAAARLRFPNPPSSFAVLVAWHARHSTARFARVLSAGSPLM